MSKAEMMQIVEVDVMSSLCRCRRVDLLAGVKTSRAMISRIIAHKKTGGARKAGMRHTGGVRKSAEYSVTVYHRDGAALLAMAPHRPLAVAARGARDA